MKDAIYLNTPMFNTARMVKDYAQRGYFVASDRAQTLASNHFGPGKELAAWEARLMDHWYGMRFEEITFSKTQELRVNQVIQLTARIHLGTLTPEDVQVELYQGSVAVDGEIHTGIATPMIYQGKDEQGKSRYGVEVRYGSSGLQGLSLRILPQHRFLNSPYDPKLILWANPEEVSITESPAMTDKPPSPMAVV
jgi:starch phosphorylase